jgi:ribose 5-phosphate isomerase RpiB
MNQQDLVEAVIKEVRRVLALRGVQIAPTPESVPAAAPRMTPAYGNANPGPAVLTASGADLTGKQVIVLKDIQSVSGSSVRVARGAVITPMAVDYAREKGITLVRVEVREKKESLAAVPATLVGLAVKSDFQGNSTMVRNFLAARGIEVREFTGQSYEAAMQALCSAVASGTIHFGICLENSGMLGPVHANRNQAIRAVHCRDLYEARAARVDIGANIIVLDAHSNSEAIVSGFTGME